MAVFDFGLIIEITIRTPYYLGNKTFTPENFITNKSQIMTLIVINANKNNTVLSQQFV